MNKRVATLQVNAAYQQAFIEVYRHELFTRYSPDYIKNISGINSFDDEKIILLRDFFLTHLYPDPSHRQKTDNAFDSLGSVLVSPGKMLPLTGSLVGSVFKLGLLLPAALKAGWRTLEIYLHSRKLETRLLEIAIEQKISQEEIKKKESLFIVMKLINPKLVTGFRSDILKLIESLSNVKLLRTTLVVMKTSQLKMKQHPDLYTDDELKGIELGLHLLASGLELFEIFSKQEMDTILKGIYIIEKTWYEDILAL